MRTEPVEPVAIKPKRISHVTNRMTREIVWEICMHARVLYGLPVLVGAVARMLDGCALVEVVEAGALRAV